MRLISFKTFKLPAIVICMLAAGICYSCSNEKNISGKEEMVIALEAQEKAGTQIPGHAGQGRAGQEKAGQEKAVLENGGGPPGKPSLPETEALGSGKAAEVAAKLFVHVCGKVNQPGVYGLPEGSRVWDAIEAAGGFQEDGAREYLNLAELVRDGMKLDVPSESQAQEWKEQGVMPAAGHGPGIVSGAAAKVNLNTASREELMGLRGIGEARAEDIIRYRETFGGFKSIEDIKNVSGIKNAAFEKIKDSITV